MAMELFKFEDGDEVTVRVRGKIVDIDKDDEEHPYLFEGKLGDDDVTVWVSEEELIGVEFDADRPLIPGDYVRTKGSKAVGMVKVLSKGQAAVDWEPFNPDAIANAWHNVTVLAGVTEEEAEEARAKALANQGSRF